MKKKTKKPLAPVIRMNVTQPAITVNLFELFNQITSKK